MKDQIELSRTDAYFLWTLLLKVTDPVAFENITKATFEEDKSYEEGESYDKTVFNHSKLVELRDLILKKISEIEK